MENKRNETGITLIALVVTVIVLIILAGISINMITGENEILNRTKEAREKTENSSDLEYLQTKAYEAITNYYALGSNEPEMEYVLKSLNSSEIATDVNTGLVTYNGKTYDISDIMGKTSEKKLIEKNGLKQVTLVNVENDNDKNILLEKDEEKNSKVRMLIYETISEGKTIKAVIPNGFYYVTGTPSTGLVISDKFEDDNNNSKGGNQFVWIPCNGGEANYQKHIYATTSVDDTKNVLDDTGNGNWKTNYYRNYSDWEDNDNRKEKEASVKKYGGFYVARYEAGEPNNADFYNDKDGSIYWQTYYDFDTKEAYGKDNSNKSDENMTYKDTYRTKNVTEQNGEKLLPVSKKNVPPWNQINQKNAKIVSENMYAKSKSITSYLMDSYAWDTMVQWVSDKKSNVTDSTLWGNYSDAKYTIKGLYAKHEHSDRWYPAYVYNYGIYDKDDERTEIATGSANRNVACNIYDLAGNVWEWTTETGNHNKGNETANNYVVVCGGSFYNKGKDAPVSRKNGSNGVYDTIIDLGFRVVLYIK